MYSQKSWGGSTSPCIIFTAMKDAPEDDSDPVVSLVIFEWRDEHLFGVYPSGSTKVGDKQMGMWKGITDALGHHRRNSFATRRT